MKKVRLLLITVILISLSLPTHVALASGTTTVEVNSGNTITLHTGESLSDIPLDINNIVVSPEALGLAAFDFTLNWDPNVIHLDSLSTTMAAMLRGFIPTVGAIDNVAGTVSMVGTTTSGYSTDDLTMVTLDITAVGNAGDSTSITVTITNLTDNELQDIPATVVNAPAKISLVTLQSIAVTPVDPSIALGLTQQFTATGTYDDTGTANITGSVSWASSNGATATIDTAGLATSLAEGTTVITASLDGITSPGVSLTVTTAELVSIAVTPVDPSIAPGLTQQFTATGTYDDTSTANITGTVSWASSNEAIATIQTIGETNPGLATSLAVGTTTLTATLYTIDGTTTLTVTKAEEEVVVTSPVAVASSVTDVSTAKDENGVFIQTVTVTSNDGKVELVINEGTVARTKAGAPLSGVSITGMEEPPAPPEDASIVSLTYDLAPDEATFDPPITLTLTYNHDNIPEGVNEAELVLAIWDETTDKWVALESGTIDTVSHTIQAPISHFTAFTVLAYKRPAAFTTTGLTISPAEVNIGESLTISVLVTNTGDLTGNYSVTLKIQNVVATKDVTLDGGASQTVTFATTGDVSGTYNVNADGLSDTFTVKAPPLKLTNWWLIGAIIAGVVLLSLVAYLLSRKRGKASGTN